MTTNNTMKKLIKVASYFIHAHNLEAKLDLWADGWFVKAFVQGEEEIYYDSFGIALLLPRRMTVREFVNLAANGQILNEEEVAEMEDRLNAHKTYFKFVF